MSTRRRIDRRAFMGMAAALPGAAALATAPHGVLASAPADAMPEGGGGASRPNILFILADDMGYGDLGLFGNPDVDTPNLDRLGGEGLCMTELYSAAPVCAPARASLLTGLYHQRTGQSMTRSWHGLSPQVDTVAKLLGSAGYATGLVGKWHLEDHGRNVPNEPWRVGFQECVKGPALSDYWDWTLDYQGTMKKSDGRYITDVFTDEAVAFIRRHRQEPFFLYLSYTAPHYPLQSREEDAQVFRDMNKFDEGVCRTYGMVRRMDYGIGRVLETLDELGLRENTLVVFASDNGPFLWPWEGMNQERFNGYFTGMKGNVQDGGIRVPGIVRWPAGLQPREQACTDLAHFVDWAPTLLAAAGVSAPEGKFDGANLLPALRGEGGITNVRRFWSWNHRCETPLANTALRDGPWKLLRPFWMHVSGYETAPEVPWEELPARPEPQLFRIDLDPYEKNNLAERFPDRVERMSRDIDAWFDSVIADFNALNA